MQAVEVEQVAKKIFFALSPCLHVLHHQMAINTFS